MVERISRGYQEIAHTADWALKVWAPDLAGLLYEAALGMNALMEMTLDRTPLQSRQIELKAEDREGLLVAFLAELLYIGESQGIGLSEGQLFLRDFHLHADLVFCQIKSQRKEIKAVTYHNLVVRETENGLETEIVFDV